MTGAGEGQRERGEEGRSHIYQGTPTDWAPRTGAVSVLWSPRRSRTV